MKLKLYREDLLPEYENISCSRTQFEHFNPEAQAAIRAVGKATFFDDEGTRLENYNVVYADGDRATESTKESFSTISGATSYAELLQQFPPRPIHNEADAAATQEVIDRLIDQQHLSQDERDYLNVLGALVYEYEETLSELQELNEQ